MLYASSKDALRRNLVGLAIEIQGTDFSEVNNNTGLVMGFHIEDMDIYIFLYKYDKMRLLLT